MMSFPRVQERGVWFLVAFGLAGCLSKPPVPATIEDLEALRAAFDPERPGHGMLDYPAFPEGDVSKSYAMVLQAELVRSVAKDTALSTLGANASDWLLHHVRPDDRGVPGWGLPVAWDAFGDGTPNPVNTVYTISTARVLEALLDQLEYDDQADRERILDVVDTVVVRFVQGDLESPSGMIAYSAEPADRGYDCFNPAMAMAGQLQRYASLFPDRPWAEACRRTADRNMSVLLKEVRLSPEGHWYWSYSIEEEVPNDLPHALYIIRGVRDYLRHGGTLAGRFDLDAVHGHLQDFRDGRGADGWRQWPLFRKDLETADPPRLYDVGIAMEYCVRTEEPEMAAELAELCLRYRGTDGRFRRCVTCPEVVNEYEANLLNGLSAFHHRFPPVVYERLTASPFPELVHGGGVPLTALRAGHQRLSWTMADGRTLLVHGTDTTDLGRRVPLGAAVLGGQLVVAARGLFEPGMELLRVGPDGSKVLTLPEPISGHQFRYLCEAWDRLWLVTYDPVTKRNRLSWSGGERWRLSEERLDIQDQLGYEHQPRLLHVVLGDTLYLAAGRAVFKIDRDAGVRTERFPVETRILELVANESDVWTLVEHLCLPPLSPADTLNTDGLEHGFSVRSIHRPRPALELPSGSLPFGLRARGDHVLLDRVQDPAGLLEMLALDLGRMNGCGALSLGIDNLEGDVVWSQSYHLTGSSDLLEFEERTNAGLPLMWAEALRGRLATELGLLAPRIPEVLRCGTFTVDRSPVLHAVQTGKFLLLAKRLQELGLFSDVDVQRTDNAVRHLKGHLEGFSTLGAEALPGEDPASSCLRFPKGCVFPYDGAGLPYNHQNCWAAGVLYAAGPDTVMVADRAGQAALDIVAMVVRRELAPRAADISLFTRPWQWNYWWGWAKEGWSPADSISVNTPSWHGDGESYALPRYRTFDAIAVLVADRYRPGTIDPIVLEYLEEALAHGGVEPFALPYYPDPQVRSRLSWATLIQYARFDQQPDLRNAFLVHGLLLERLTGE